jgi:hypothetical protein
MVDAAVAKRGHPDNFMTPLPGQVIKVQQDLRKLLQEQKAADAVQNLYEHIVDVVDKIVQYCPDKAIERFEEISYLVKKGDAVKLEEFIKTNDFKEYAVHCPMVAAGTADKLGKIKELVRGGDGEVTGGEGEEGAAAIGNLQDLMSINKNVFNTCGIDFGEYGTLILQKSLKKLVVES